MPVLLGQGEQLVLQAEAVDLDAGDDHRPLRRLPQRAAASATRLLASRLGSLGGLDLAIDVHGYARHDVHQVARHLDVDRPLVRASTASSTRSISRKAVDRIVDRRRRTHSDLSKTSSCVREVFDLVVQQRIVHPLARCPAQPLITTTGDFSA